MPSRTARPKAERNRFTSSGMCSKGPPRNTTVPSMGRPQASPPSVWRTTASKALAAISAVRAPSLSSGRTSVWANTAQRDAMG